MIYLVTPTGARPEGMALLAGYVNDQTYAGPMCWIVVDDCDPATQLPAMRDGLTVEVVRPAWRWSPGMNTQAASMAAGLARVPDDALVLVLEDDDAYLPDHIAATVAALQQTELTGERVARYFNVATGRGRAIPGTRHASLASTGCRGGALALLKHLCAAGSRRIDIDLWTQYRGSKRLTAGENVVGIKGMPGRAGIGVGHRLGFGEPDDGTVLAEWLGAHRAEAYRAYRSQ